MRTTSAETNRRESVCLDLALLQRGDLRQINGVDDFVDGSKVCDIMPGRLHDEPIADDGSHFAAM